MSGLHLLEAMGLLDDDLIQEAERYRRVRPRAQYGKWLGWAASFAVVLVLGYGLTHLGMGGGSSMSGGNGAAAPPAGAAPSSPAAGESKENQSAQNGAAPDSAGGSEAPCSPPEELAPDGLPLLEPGFADGGMGFEGLLYYRFSEMDNGNPWREEMEPETLPVFRNGAYHPSGVPVGLGVEEMEERARAAGAALGLEDLSITYRRAEIEDDVIPYDQIVCVTAIARGVEIDAMADGGLVVQFDGGLPLPEEYQFAYHGTTRQEAEAVLDYLTDRYAALLNLRQPQKALFGEYNIYGEFSWDYRVYDAAGDDTEDLLNYGYRCVQFAPDGNGNLALIRLCDGLACAEKLGDYPVISLEEARQSLLEGKYFTSVPVDFPGEDYVCGGELVYRNVAVEKVLLPYYRFYAELPEEEQENGLKLFGAYYVPAIEPRYFKEGWEARWYF